MTMITCYLKYTIDPYKLEAFEQYAKLSGAIPQNFIKSLETLRPYESRYAEIGRAHV